MIRPLPATFAAITALTVAGAVLAQGHDHAQMPLSVAAKAAPAEGEVRKVDKARGRVVLKHGPLTALDMPAMTMEFTASDPALLANVKEGDQVCFTPARAKDGSLMVTSLEVLKR
jgi:Cu/Ag efflux protein CusF